MKKALVILKRLCLEEWNCVKLMFWSKNKTKKSSVFCFPFSTEHVWFPGTLATTWLSRFGITEW